MDGWKDDDGWMDGKMMMMMIVVVERQLPKFLLALLGASTEGNL